MAVLVEILLRFVVIAAFHLTIAPAHSRVDLLSAVDINVSAENGLATAFRTGKPTLWTSVWL